MPVVDWYCLKLASKGWCGGNPQKIARMPVSWVLKMLSYQDFIFDYQQESYNLNQNK